MHDLREGNDGVSMGSNDTSIDSQATAGSTPEDVARLYAWANLRGAKYRDYSASRREHRAQVRYRAAKALLDRELKAQAEAEASAEAAEREAQEAEARALSARENQPQQLRFAALRTAEAAALKAAADRVEAARRAEAAAHANVVALREQRELAEAGVSAAEQATIYTESEALRRRLAGPQPSLSLEENGAASPPAVSVEAEPVPAETSVTEDATQPLKAGAWQPLSEVILEQAEEWTAPTPVPGSEPLPAGPQDQLRPAWFVVLPQNEPTPEPPAAARVESPAPVTLSEQVAVDPHRSTDGESTVAALPPPESVAASSDPVPGSHALEQGIGTPAEDFPALVVQQLREIRTPLLAVFSLGGGAGTTSAVAGIGRALSAAGEKLILVDATSQARLPFHFGGRKLSAGLMRTWSPPDGTGEPISLVLHDATQAGDDETAQDRITREMWVSMSGAQRVLTDISAPAVWLLGRWAHLRPVVLVPLVAGLDSVTRIEATEKLFRDIFPADSQALLPFYVLNRFDASLPLHLEFRSVLRRRLGDRLLRITIRNSPVVPEALADGNTVLDYAPEAGVAQEYRDIAAWLRQLSPAREADAAHLPGCEP